MNMESMPSIEMSEAPKENNPLPPKSFKEPSPKEPTQDDRERLISKRIGIVNNRPNGEKTERAVFNTPNLKGQEHLTYQDAKEFFDQDIEETRKVATLLTEKIGSNVDEDTARNFLHERMKDLFLKTLEEVKRTQEKENTLIETFEQKEKNLQTELESTWPWQFAEKRKLRTQLEALRETHRDDLKPFNHLPRFESGRQYFLDRTTASLVLAGARRGRDIVLLFKSENKNLALRLNTIQLDLAKRGVYYKGEPSDNTYDKSRRDWDQAAYPQSPINFYNEHVSTWLDKNPEEANEVLTSVKSQAA